jgi:hypothetical protein
VTDKPSTLGAELLGGLLGAAVAVGCILPPILHLVTGPLGPLIGGFVAASRINPGTRGRAIIAVTVGTLLAGAVGAVASVIAALSPATPAAGSGVPNWLTGFVAGPALFSVLAIVWTYATAMAAVGTAISGALSRKRASA